MTKYDNEDEILTCPLPCREANVPTEGSRIKPEINRRWSPEGKGEWKLGLPSGHLVSKRGTPNLDCVTPCQ